MGGNKLHTDRLQGREDLRSLVAPRLFKETSLPTGYAAVRVVEGRAHLNAIVYERRERFDGL